MKDKMKDKKKEGLSDLAKHAKMSVLKDIHDFAADDMSSRLKGMKKISVASDSSEGLDRGLDKAKEILAHAVTGRSPVEAHDENLEDAEAIDDVMEPKEMPENEPNMKDGQDEVEEESPEHESMENSEHEEMEHEHPEMSEEEIDKQIAHLHMLKNKKRMG